MRKLIDLLMVIEMERLDGDLTDDDLVRAFEVLCLSREPLIAPGLLLRRVWGSPAVDLEHDGEARRRLNAIIAKWFGWTVDESLEPWTSPTGVRCFEPPDYLMMLDPQADNSPMGLQDFEDETAKLFEGNLGRKLTDSESLVFRQGYQYGLYSARLQQSGKSRDNSSYVE